MQRLRLLMTGGILLLLTGCFQITTTVRVNPDGSGTVEETMLLSKKMVAQMEAMMQGVAGESGGKSKLPDLFDPAKLKEDAGIMGTGVTYVSGKKAESADYTGYTATYAFTDINQLRLSQESSPPTGDAKSGALPLTFRFTKGSPATLTIMQKEAPSTEKAVPSAAPAAEPKPAAIQPQLSDADAKKLLDMFLGMKLVVAVEVNGDIVSTNAAYRSGNRVTLLDFDLAKLGAAGPGLDKLAQLQNGSLEDAKELMKSISGIKMDLNDNVTVVFGK